MRNRVNTPADEIWESGPTHRKKEKKNYGTSEAEGTPECPEHYRLFVELVLFG